MIIRFYKTAITTCNNFLTKKIREIARNNEVESTSENIILTYQKVCKFLDLRIEQYEGGRILLSLKISKKSSKRNSKKPYQ